MKPRRKKRRVGDIIRISLAGGRCSFGQVLPSPLVAFFDIAVPEASIPDVATIAARPVLFRIDVMNYAIGDDFPVLGNVEPRPELLEPPRFFKQDSITGELFISTDGSDEIPATFEECLGLECLAAWEPEHVIERLEDHFAGRPNRWVEMMRPKVRGPQN